MENSWEVVFGFVGGSHETTNVKDEARALAIANAVATKAGGAGAWINLHPDADGQRLAVCFKGAGPIHTIRVRKSVNGTAEPTPAPEPTKTPDPATPEEMPPQASLEPKDGMH